MMSNGLKRAVGVTCALLIAILLPAQNVKNIDKDSLRRFENEDPNKIIEYVKTSQPYLNQQYNKETLFLFVFLSEAYLALELQDTLFVLLDSLKSRRAFENNALWKAQLLYLNGRIAEKQEKLTTAKELLNKAHEIYMNAGRSKGEIKCLVALANIENQEENLDKALEYSLLAVDKARKARNNILIADALYNSGAILTGQKNGNMQSAAYNFKEALALYYSEGLYYDACLIENALAFAFIFSGDTSLTANQLKKALKCAETFNNKRLLAAVYNNYGVWLNKKKNHDQALDWYKKHLTISRQLNNKSEILKAYNNIGGYYYDVDQEDKALPYYKSARDLALELNDRRLLSTVYENLSLSYYYLNDYKNAYDNYKLHVAYKDSVFNEKQEQQIANLLTLYETRQKEDSIKAQKIELERMDLAANETRLERNIFLISAILLLLLAASIYLFFRQRIRAKSVIAQHQEQLNREQMIELIRSKEISAMNALVEGQELERRRVSEELHDNLGSVLATVKLRFDDFGNNLKDIPLEQKQDYLAATDLLDAACAEVRKISHNLVTGTIAEFGLVAAVRELADIVGKGGKIRLKVLVNGQPTRLNHTLEISAYRIIQELVGNIIKHSEAKNSVISLNFQSNKLNIIVEDDGKGFLLSGIKVKKGIGLKSVSERVELLTGSLNIDSTPGSGTTVIIDLPLN